VAVFPVFLSPPTAPPPRLSLLLLRITVIGYRTHLNETQNDFVWTSLITSVKISIQDNIKQGLRIQIYIFENTTEATTVSKEYTFPLAGCREAGGGGASLCWFSQLLGSHNEAGLL
jgi:hypothetical protein